MIVIPLFIFTRSMAARNRSMNTDIARTWYQAGQQRMKADDNTAAVDAFRNAATKDRDNPQYVLSLAAALAAADHLEEARQALLRLRTNAPENGEINLNLARLAVKIGDTAEAVRYYHNALFGMWPADETVNQRVNIRTELVQFLLARGATSQALSELLILGSDIPDTVPSHNTVGRLFLAARDSQHALDEFTTALRIDGKNPQALAGAGEASFNLADYRQARSYFQAAIVKGDTSSEVETLMMIAQLVLSSDPLAPGLRTDARVRILMADLESAGEDLRACIDRKRGDQSSISLLEPLRLETEHDMKTDLRASALRREPDGFRLGLNLIYRIGLATEQICGTSTPLHKALRLIASKHGAVEQQ
jgi:tetratricopeptide (TPR) repeat protein